VRGQLGLFTSPYSSCIELRLAAPGDGTVLCGVGGWLWYGPPTTDPSLRDFGVQLGSSPDAGSIPRQCHNCPVQLLFPNASLKWYTQIYSEILLSAIAHTYGLCGCRSNVQVLTYLLFCGWDSKHDTHSEGYNFIFIPLLQSKMAYPNILKYDTCSISNYYPALLQCLQIFTERFTIHGMNYMNITEACYHKIILTIRDFHFIPTCDESHLLRVCTQQQSRVESNPVQSDSQRHSRPSVAYL